jgi:HSP20 family protein
MWMLATRRPTELASDVANLQGRITRLMNEVLHTWPFGPFGEDGTIASAWVPPVDIFEDNESLKIVAELPGVRPEDVRISHENNALTIRGEKKQVAEEKTERVHRYERTYGTFERTFTLPSTVDAERIQATYENGVLTVLLPKVERARPREIPIRVGQ